MLPLSFERLIGIPVWGVMVGMFDETSTHSESSELTDKSKILLLSCVVSVMVTEWSLD